MIGTSAAYLAAALATADASPAQARVLPPPPPPPTMRHPFNVPFDRGSAEVTPTNLGFLRVNVLGWLRGAYRPDHFIWISGHADDAGSSQANLQLGCRRALAIRSFLEQHGFDQADIAVQSGGDAYPFSREQRGHPANRRVDILLEPYQGHPGTSSPEPLERADNC